MEVIFVHMYGFRLGQTDLYNLFEEEELVEQILFSNKTPFSLTDGIVIHHVDFEHSCLRDHVAGEENAILIGVEVDKCDLLYSGAMEVNHSLPREVVQQIQQFIDSNGEFEAYEPKHYVYLDLNK